MSAPHKTGILLAALVATGLAGCAHQFALPVSGPPLGYEQRHPILLTRSTHSATLDVGRHSGGLSSLQRTEVEGFARSFRVDGTGELSIHVPAGAPNERTAFGMAGDIQSVLVSQGVPPTGVIVRAYQPTPGVSAPPILLSYGRVRAAVPHRCGVTADMDIDLEGRQWDNMGCSDRQNFAAMIANPNDLVSPRPMDRIDGANRYRVIDTWRAGQDTTTQIRNEAAGTITRTGR
jgi:pilus assembly protein CpaD